MAEARDQLDAYRCPDCHPLTRPRITNCARLQRRIILLCDGRADVRGTADDFREAARLLAEAAL